MKNTPSPSPRTPTPWIDMYCILTTIGILFIILLFGGLATLHLYSMGILQVMFAEYFQPDRVAAEL